MGIEKIKEVIKRLKEIYDKAKKVKDTVEEVKAPTEELLDNEALLAKMLAEAKGSNVGFDNCDNDDLKEVYVVVNAINNQGISKELEKLKSAPDWRQFMSKKIWGVDSLSGWGEFGPKKAPGETSAEYNRRREMGARNAIAELEQIADTLASEAVLLETLGDAQAIANSFGVGYATLKGTSVAYSCGMLMDSIGKRATGGAQRLNKILNSMNWLIPSLQRLEPDLDEGLNSLSPSAGRSPSSKARGFGSTKDPGPIGRG